MAPWPLFSSSLRTIATFIVFMGVAGLPAAADDAGAFPPPGWHAPVVRIEEGEGARHHAGTRRLAHRRTVAPAGPVAYRGLTINRDFDRDAGIDDGDSVFDDGETRYGDIRRFNPAPYATSGTQLPFGLDGIGGFGSDLGFSAGEDSSDYQRVR